MLAVGEAGRQGAMLIPFDASGLSPAGVMYKTIDSSFRGKKRHVQEYFII